MELASIAGSAGKRAYDIFVDCFKEGALVRPAGDVLVIAPVVNTLADSVKAHA